MVIAIGVQESGERDVLGFDLGSGEKRSLLAGIPAQLEAQGAQRRLPGHQRCS